MKSSPSTTTLKPITLSAEELIWMASLPDELLSILSREEIATLTRIDSSQWPEELTKKVGSKVDPIVQTIYH